MRKRDKRKRARDSEINKEKERMGKRERESERLKERATEKKENRKRGNIECVCAFVREMEMNKMLELEFNVTRV